MQKTFISVDALGTKAGAATSTEMTLKCAPNTNTTKVVLDRPFLYAIVDSSTNIPIFIGTVVHLDESS